MSYIPDKETILRRIQFATEDIHEAVNQLLDAAYEDKETIETLRKIEKSLDDALERMTNE